MVFNCSRASGGKQMHAGTSQYFFDVVPVQLLGAPEVF